MNYDHPINQIAEQIKADKSIHPQWRNKAVARLNEAQAFVNYGRNVTALKPPAVNDAQAGKSDGCICPAGTYDFKNCPVHKTAPPMRVG